VANKESDLLSFMTGPNTPPLNTTPELLKEMQTVRPNEKVHRIQRHVPSQSRWWDFTQGEAGEIWCRDISSTTWYSRQDLLFAHWFIFLSRDFRFLMERGTSVFPQSGEQMMLGDGVHPWSQCCAAG